MKMTQRSEKIKLETLITKRLRQREEILMFILIGFMG